jgi:DNA polymerase (family X)
LPFEPYAYQKAALTLETLKDDIGAIYHAGGLKVLREIPSIGENIAKKIEEVLTTGKLRYYEDLKKKMPIDLDEIVRVEGVGPKKAKILYEKLGVTNLQAVLLKKSGTVPARQIASDKKTDALPSSPVFVLNGQTPLC